MEADVAGLIGAGRHERSVDRLNYPNGYRDCCRDTRLGSLQLRVPKLRQGSYFPPFLAPRKTAEKVLVTAIQELGSAVFQPGASTSWCRRWASPASQRATVSKLCKDIDEQVELPSDPLQTGIHRSPKAMQKAPSQLIVAARAQASRRCQTQALLSGKPLSSASVSVP